MTPKKHKQKRARIEAEEDAALMAWFQENVSDPGLIEWYKAKISNNEENWVDRFERVLEKEEQLEKPRQKSSTMMN